MSTSRPLGFVREHCGYADNLRGGQEARKAGSVHQYAIAKYPATATLSRTV
jgi:hypothetical protein